MKRKFEGSSEASASPKEGTGKNYMDLALGLDPGKEEKEQEDLRLDPRPAFKNSSPGSPWDRTREQLQLIRKSFNPVGSKGVDNEPYSSKIKYMYCDILDY